MSTETLIRRGGQKHRGPRHEEYCALLDRFRAHAERRGLPFQVAMRQALAAAMGEAVTVPPAAGQAWAARRAESGESRPGWSPQRRAKFMATQARKRLLAAGSHAITPSPDHLAVGNHSVTYEDRRAIA